MIKAKCDICGEHVTSQYDDAALARSLGLHKWNKHGIKGKFHASNALKRAEENSTVGVEREVVPVNTRGLPDSAISPAQLRRRQYQRNWWARKYPTLKGHHKVPPQSSEVVPCKLDTCPHCGSRFYVARGQPV